MSDKSLNYFKGDDLASSVWIGKYKYQGEETPNDMHKRMSKELYRAESKYNVDKKLKKMLSSYGQKRKSLTEEKIYHYLKDFKYIIPQGSIMSILGTDTIGSLSNCVVVKQPYDSYGGIMRTDEELAQLFKRRCGVGVDISDLRPSGSVTDNAAKTSTGAVSFMNRFSETTREVAQSGRRGALMLTMDIRHPDIMDFIKIKRDLSKVTGANISIRVRDEFMEAVKKDEDYILRFPIDHQFSFERANTELPEYDNHILEMEYNESLVVSVVGDEKIYVRRIRAKEYWDEIIRSARDVAEPGIIFVDKHWNHSPDGVYPQYKGVTTNPCGEIFMQPYDACRLVAVNLLSFVDKPFTKDARFDYEKFYEVSYEALRLGDDIIDLEIERIKNILAKIKSDPEPWEIKSVEYNLWVDLLETAMQSRRIGMGFTALGDMLAAMNITYGSEDSLYIVSSVMQAKMEAELDSTIDLAIERGSFNGWDKDLEFSFDPMSNDIYGENEFYKMIRHRFPEQTLRMFKYGRRNVSWSTVAPTGSVSILTQTTSGIEPLFQPYYIRRKKVNPDDKGVRVDFVDDNGDSWTEYPMLHHQFKKWMMTIMSDNVTVNGKKLNVRDSDYLTWNKIIEDLSEKDIKKLFEESPWYQATANDIDWENRVKLQGIIQKYITHSISSTINLPEEVSYEEVDTIYQKSWRENLKGVTIYRDGSRSGVLVVEEPKTTIGLQRPEKVECDIYHNVTKGQKFTTLIGLVDKKPYEIFCIPGHIATNYEKGVLVKLGNGKYELDCAPDENYGVFPEITDGMPEDIKALSIGLSYCLRYGVPVDTLVRKMNQIDASVVSFPIVMARNLAKYMTGEVKKGFECPNCKETNTVIFEEGCQTCKNCGWSQC